MSLAALCNTCWMAACRREVRAFERDTRRVATVQAEWLQRLLHRERDTWFGRQHCFAAIHTPREFQDAVPLATYEDHRAAIERIANGETNVLTAERVRLFEPTGGSTSGEKLIPYTSALSHSFQQAIRVWIWDLYSQRPAARRGRSYWSITPLSAGRRRTKAGIPIGFADDASYLGKFEKWLVARTMVVPPEVAQCPTTGAARYATLFFLLRAADLSLISVWSPTFLTELLAVLWANRERLCDDIAAGRITSDANSQRSAVSDRPNQPLPERASQLRSIFRRATNITECVPELWPSLSLISCWADGPSAVHANRLRQSFPGIELQAKGLLATEAFVTIPLLAQPAPALAFRSHFFEFQPASEATGNRESRPLLATELTPGQRYRLIVTNGGGLYRYPLHDEVEVVGFKNETPLLRFLGKTDDVSDLVGEKLSAAHVEAALQATFRELNLSPTFAQLRAEPNLRPRYTLQITAAALHDNASLQQRLRAAVEERLATNPGYHYARQMSQLDELQLELVDQQQADAIESTRTAKRVAAGQRHGNIKPAPIAHASQES